MHFYQKMATKMVTLSFQGLLLGLIVSTICCHGSSLSKSLQRDRRSSEGTEKSKWKVLVCEGKAKLYGFKEDVMKEATGCEPTCRHFCHLKIFNLTSEKGLPDEGKFMKWVDKSFPEKYKNFSRSFFGDCFEKYGKQIDLSDKECKVADQFADCTWGLVPHLKCEE